MSIFTVDADRCNSCGMCAAECPARIIEINEPKAMPSLADGGEERCINCGHCVAVCPLEAIYLDTMKLEDCVPVRKELLPSPEQVEHFLRSRRSIRSYEERPVPREMLAKLIDIARYAPSGSNSQLVQWLVVEDTKEVKRLSGLVVDWMRSMIKLVPETADVSYFDRFMSSWERGEDPILRGAPHVIVAHAAGDPLSAGHNSSIALTYLELAAYALGLGACWAGFFQMAAAFHPPMAEDLKLPEGHKCMGAMMIGYPNYKYSRIPLRNEPKIIWR